MSIFTLPKYSPDELSNLRIRLLEIFDKFIPRSSAPDNLKTNQGRQFYNFGLMRRLFIIRDNYEYLIETFPPDRTKASEETETREAAIHLNSFYLHLWGCLDNLAWIIAYEIQYKDIENKASHHFEGKGEINLFPSNNQRKNNTLRKIIRQQHMVLETLLCEFDRWIKELGEFRHPAAHRIPLCVIPYFLSQEQTLVWNTRFTEYERLKQKGCNEQNIQYLEEAARIMDSFVELGEFFPFFAHEIQYTDCGEVKLESFSPLYPTIVDDSEKLLSLIEKCFGFLGLNTINR